MFKAKVLTLFPEMFPGSLGFSIAGKALEKDLWSLETINIRDFAKDVHKTVDDTPFGGGAGMVMKPDIVSDAVSSVKNAGRIIYLSPRGEKFNQKKAKELSLCDNITFVCGRYEGLDQRVIDHYQMEELSVGDYVLSGGELGAMIVIDACVRLLPDVMGNKHTVDEESFENGLLEYPHYTRPADWVAPDGEVYSVPETLTSGHHENIKKWRLEKSKEITKEKRPDLFSIYEK